ncbi:type VI secretion system accessory protein TagV [Serratia sp. L9]|uniref:type VI secretion system accessory protein TagV n=1 Tax=Serratia sp. L9 TaxID=3423946 RepID=UPI003D6643B1
MKIRISPLLFSALLLCACTPRSEQAITDDTLVSHQVNGVMLTHRAIISLPEQFQPINEQYRSLYSASIMSTPSYKGKLLGQLENATPFFALGEVENQWLAISMEDRGELIGYIQGNAGVIENQYRATVRKDRLRVRRTKTTNSAGHCVSVGNNSKACKETKSDTWILE